MEKLAQSVAHKLAKLIKIRKPEMAGTGVDKVKLSNHGAFLAQATIHWGAHGSGPRRVNLMADSSHTWSLDKMGVPERWGFWANVHAALGETVNSDKDEYIYMPNTGITVHFKNIRLHKHDSDRIRN